MLYLEIQYAYLGTALQIRSHWQFEFISMALDGLAGLAATSSAATKMQIRS